MAKQAVSGIERHVEKLLVAVTGAVLIGSIGLYLLKSPRDVPVVNQGDQGPAEVDAAVRKVADDLDRAIEDADHRPIPVENPLEKLRKIRNNPEGTLPTTLASPLPWTLRTVPNVVDDDKMKKIQIPEVFAPDQIVVAKGRTTIVIQAPAELGKPESEAGRDAAQEDRIWMAVGGEIDVARQRTGFLAKGYSASRSGTFVAEVLLHRRELLPDGTWGQWEKVNTYAAHRPPPVPQVTSAENPGEAALDTKATETLQAYMKLIGEHQDEIARPLPPAPVAGDTWVPPPLKNVNVSEYISAAPKSKEPEKTREAVAEIALSGPEAMEAIRKQLEDLKAQSRYAEAADLADRYSKKVSESTTEERQKRIALGLLKRFADDVRKAEKAAQPVDQPTSAGAERIGVWAYDATVRPGQTYQYQLAVNLLNSYAGLPELWGDPREAAKPVFEGKWSQPSAAVKAPELTRFFLDKVASPTEASVEVWRWQKGQWHFEKFRDVQVGGMIGDKRSDRTADVEVDYSTNAMVVQVAKEQKCRLVAPTGSKGVEETQSDALIFMDASGRLGERLESVDSKDPWRKERKEELKQKTRKTR